MENCAIGRGLQCESDRSTRPVAPGEVSGGGTPAPPVSLTFQVTLPKPHFTLYVQGLRDSNLKGCRFQDRPENHHPTVDELSEPLFQIEP